MTGKRKIFIILFLIISFLNVIADDVSFTATVDKVKVGLRGQVLLNFTLQGQEAIHPPNLQRVEGFDCRYIGPSTVTSMVNGKTSFTVTYRYQLIALREGKFTIPSVSVKLKDKTLSTEPIEVQVTKEAVSKKAKDEPTNIDDKISLTLEVDKNKVYVNEMIPITITLFINNLPIKDVEFPKLQEKGFSFGDYEKPKQFKKAYKGILHDVIEFKTYAFATRSGKITVGPASIGCNLLIKERSSSHYSSSFFDDEDFFPRYKTHPIQVESHEFSLTVLSLPKKEKPVDFTGAIGDFDFSLTASPIKLKLGDPITLRMEISGEGNFRTVNLPSLKIDEDFKMYDPDTKQSGHTKTFEQIIIPKDDKIKEIPAISFSFFDPKTGNYKTIKQGPIPLELTALSANNELEVYEIKKDHGIPEKEHLGRDIIHIKENPGKLSHNEDLLVKNKLFLLAQIVPLLALFGVICFQRRHDRMSQDRRYARKVKAYGIAKRNLTRLKSLVKEQKPQEFFEGAFKILQQYLGDKFDLPNAGITSNVVDLLHKKDIEKEVLDKIVTCFESCDVARFTHLSLPSDEMQKTLDLLEEIIVILEKGTK